MILFYLKGYWLGSNRETCLWNCIEPSVPGWSSFLLSNSFQVIFCYRVRSWRRLDVSYAGIFHCLKLEYIRYYNISIQQTLFLTILMLFQRQRRLPEEHARFYSAEISLALNFLHERGKYIQTFRKRQM